jgi:hypothetical protein
MSRDIQAIAASFRHLPDIVKMLRSGVSVTHLPLTPLYYTLKKYNPQVVREFLPLCSPKQRQAFLDLDLWRKDELDIGEFSFWLDVYGGSEREDLMLEFILSPSFAAYFKGRFAIATFDVEDPQYPDDDNYFLTEDQLLIIEFDKSFDQVDDIKRLLRVLYSHLGVEKAYQYLLTLVVESFAILEETEFQAKKERLREFGVVDYYEALELLAPYRSIDQMTASLQGRIRMTPHLLDVSKREVPSSELLSSLSGPLLFLQQEGDKVIDPERADFIRFSFIRLVHAVISSGHALKDGPVSLKRLSLEINQALLIGASFLKKQFALTNEQSLFDLFDVLDTYKAGVTLLAIVPAKLKRALHDIEEELGERDTWLGDVLAQFLEHTYLTRPHLLSWKEGERTETLIIDEDMYRTWDKQADSFIELIPLIKRFILLKHNFNDKNFEDLILSACVKLTALKWKGDIQQKTFSLEDLYLNKDEIIFVTQRWFAKGSNSSLHEDLVSFISSMGIKDLDGIVYWLKMMVTSSLQGVNFLEMKEESWEHLTGLLLQDDLH